MSEASAVSSGWPQSASVVHDSVVRPVAEQVDEPDSLDPLVLDLDGTLLHTNVLLECAISYLKQYPLGLFWIALWLCHGRARLKRELAHRVRLDPADLPINTALEAYAVAEKARGRLIYLATAADRSIAQSVADRCGFFDGVLASDGLTNLKGRSKLVALDKLFPLGFAYAGDSRADYVIWSRANQVIVVGEQGWAGRAVRRFTQPNRIFPVPSRLRALLKCGRPHQWAKNCLVFVPAVLGGAAGHTDAMLATTLSFLALCITASATYIMNDLWDVADDRKHWTKRKRPIASGRLPVSTAIAAVPVGLTVGLVVAGLAAPGAALILSGYLLLTVLYSFCLKRVPILDVIVLAGLFTIRLLLGIVSARVFASPWLLVFSMFLFTSLCFAKRYTELERAMERGTSALTSRGYVAKDAQLVFSLGIGTGIASITIMVLYIMFDAFRQTFYGNTTWLWAFPVILFVWFARIWLMASRGNLDDDPVAFAVNDTPSILLGAAILLAFILAWSGTFG